jgi:hypothetical protein
MFQVTGAFAEFERSMIKQRINAGLKGPSNRASNSGVPAYPLRSKSASRFCCAPRRACWRSPKRSALVAVRCSALRGK